MNETTVFNGIKVQGSSDIEAWVTTFNLAYTNNTANWTYVTDRNDITKVNLVLDIELQVQFATKYGLNAFLVMSF